MHWCTNLESYHLSMKCKEKVVVDKGDQEFGQCIKCKMSQCVEGCKKPLTAQVMAAAGKTHMTLRAIIGMIMGIHTWIIPFCSQLLHEQCHRPASQIPKWQRTRVIKTMLKQKSLTV